MRRIINALRPGLAALLAVLALAGPSPAGSAPAAGVCEPYVPTLDNTFAYDIAIGLPGAGRDPGADLEAARELLERNFARLACAAPGSEIAQVNQLAGTRSGRLSRATYDLVLRSLGWKDQTRGTVDLLAGPLHRLWHEHRPLRCGERSSSMVFDVPRPGDTIAVAMESRPTWRVDTLAAAWPAPAALDSALRLARDGGTYFVDLGVLLRDPGMELDLDPVLDGVLADRSLDSLRAWGQGGLRVRVGGVWRDDGLGREPWPLTLRDMEGTRLGVLELTNQALAVCEGGVHHVREGRPVGALVDPRDGRPRLGALAWAVAPTGEAARVWARALALLGPEEGLPLLAAQPGVAGAWLGAVDGAAAWRATESFPMKAPRGLDRPK